MKKYIGLLLLCWVALASYAAPLPSFGSINTYWFRTNGWFLTINTNAFQALLSTNALGSNYVTTNDLRALQLTNRGSVIKIAASNVFGGGVLSNSVVVTNEDRANEIIATNVSYHFGLNKIGTNMEWGQPHLFDYQESTAGSTNLSTTSGIIKFEPAQNTAHIIAPSTGKYFISATVGIKYSGVTYASLQTLNLKLTNTVQSTFFGIQPLLLPQLTTYSGGAVVPITCLANANENDTIYVWAQLSANPGAGTVQCTNINICAFRIQ